MVRGIVFFVAVLVGWLSSYLSGAFPWLGFTQMTRSNFGVGPITIVGEDRRGLDFGLETFVFFEGQEIVIDYDAEIRRGSLKFYVYQPFDGEFGEGDSVYITKTGKGEWTLPIGKTAIYHVSIDTSPIHGAGTGWDLSYTVKWGARRATAGATRRPPGKLGLRVETR